MSDPFENDLTHTQHPEQGWAQPEEVPPPETRPLRRRRLIQLAFVVAIAGAAILAIVTSTGTTESSRARLGGALPGEIEHATTSLLAGIPQSANTLGSTTAPVTLKWFGDLECPFCKEFALGALPSLIQRWVRTGQLKIEYLSFETATREPKVFESQEVAALAAGMQNKMWNFLETFLHEQGEEGSGYVTERFLKGIADQIPGMNEGLWVEDRHDPVLVTRFAAGQRFAGRAGLHATPSFLIAKRGGAVARLAPKSLVDPKEFNVAIEYLLGVERSPKLQSVLYLRQRPLAPSISD
jgi:protein-disulfide isomerase